MGQLYTLLVNWIEREPAASLWLLVASVLVFGLTFSRSLGAAQGAWAWFSRLFEAAAKALVFAGLLGGFYFFLLSSFDLFSKIYSSFTTAGSLSNQGWSEWSRQYGSLFIQRDLQVAQYVKTRSVEMIQPTPPSQRILYRNAEIEQLVQQNSLVGFAGQVTIELAEPELQGNVFSGFAVSANYNYRVINPSSSETRLEFRFPISSGIRLMQDIRIKIDGAEIPYWRVDEQSLLWEDRFQPGQAKTVSIAYQSRGMDSYLFEIPEPREVTDFNLTLAHNSAIYGTRTEPLDSSIKVEEETVPPYKLIHWSIERSFMAPVMGIYFPQQWPYAPYHEMIAALSYAARSAVLYLALAAITLLVFGLPVSLRQFALLAALFALPFLPLLAGGLPHPASLPPEGVAAWQVKMLPLLSLIPLVLAFFTLRGIRLLPLVLLLLWMAFFINFYPLLSLQMDEQKRIAAENLVQAGMIAYVFVISIFVRLRKSPLPGG
jgi:hypothetical protein